MYIATAGVVTSVLWLFYHHALVIAPGLFSGFAGIMLYGRIKAERKGETLKKEFCDFLSAFASSLEAGEAPEHAVVSAYNSISELIPEDSALLAELTGMIRRIHMSENLEDAMLGFADRAKDEDVSRFAEVFALAKRRGGNIKAVIRGSVSTIQEKAEVRRQIRTVITAKRLEALIMVAMPPGMLLYFLVTDSGFLAPLYTGTGRLFMTVLLAVYAGCIAMILKMTRIEV